LLELIYSVLNLISSLNPAGGGPMEGIRQGTPYLAELGVQSTVACLDDPAAPWLEGFPCRVEALGPGWGRYGYRRGLVPQLRALAADHDVVIVHGLWQYHGLLAWRALHGGPVPYLVQTHGMLDPWFKRRYPFKHLKKWCYWPWADYRLLRDAEAVLFTCERERQLARQSFWLYRAKERVIAYGTAAPPGEAAQQREQFLQRWPQLRGQRLLLFLGRIHPKKGVDLLIEAFAAAARQEPMLQLVLAGPDQLGLQADLQRRAIQLDVADRLHWLGMLSGDLKWGAFHAAELFCLPSHQENFGIAVAEALACGLPVAIAEPVNISGEVAEASAGLVHDDTVAGTTAALQQWLALPEAERRAMGERGLALFAERFEIRAAARDLKDLVLPLAHRGTGRA
jgi:glycosyltransferase involved in cell wall biosynthesis